MKYKSRMWANKENSFLFVFVIIALANLSIKTVESSIMRRYWKKFPADMDIFDNFKVYDTYTISAFSCWVFGLSSPRLANIACYKDNHCTLGYSFDLLTIKGIQTPGWICYASSELKTILPINVTDSKYMCLTHSIRNQELKANRKLYRIETIF